MKIVWTSAASRDLKTIGETTRQERSDADAVRVMGMIRQRTDDLANFPQKGRAGRVPETRELVVIGTPFIVPYRVREGCVEILAVFHASRQWTDGF